MSKAWTWNHNKMVMYSLPRASLVQNESEHGGVVMSSIELEY